MFEFSLGAWLIALILVGASKSKVAAAILGVLTIILVISLAKSCSDYEIEEQQRIERQDEISRQIRERKEYYNRKYGGVQWDAPASSPNKSDNE